MITATTSLNEIKNLGLQVLLERLGPVGMIRFLQQLEIDHGDYTAEREIWLTETDLDVLTDNIQQQTATGNLDGGFKAG